MLKKLVFLLMVTVIFVSCNVPTNNKKELAPDFSGEEISKSITDDGIVSSSNPGDDGLRAGGNLASTYTNVSDGKIVAASYVAPYIPANLLDDDPNTIWGSREAIVNIDIDLGKPTVIYGMDLKWYQDYYASSFMIYIGNDVYGSKKWNQALKNPYELSSYDSLVELEVTGYVHPANPDIAASPLEGARVARYIRIQCRQKSGTKDAYAIKDLRIFGFDYPRNEVLSYGFRMSEYGAQTGFTKNVDISADPNKNYYSTNEYAHSFPVESETSHEILTALAEMGTQNYDLLRTPIKLMWGIAECLYVEGSSGWVPDPEGKTAISFEPPSGVKIEPVDKIEVSVGDVVHSAYFEEFDKVDTSFRPFEVYLAIEPAKGDVVKLIDLALTKYGDYDCVKGILIDCEYLGSNTLTYNESLIWDIPGSDEDGKGYLEQIKGYNPDYELIVKHWEFYQEHNFQSGQLNFDPLPNTVSGSWDGVTFICDNQDNGQFTKDVDDNYIDIASWKTYNKYMLLFAEQAYPNNVMFQIGYPADWLVVNPDNDDPHDPVHEEGTSGVYHVPWLATIEWAWTSGNKYVPDDIPLAEYSKLHTYIANVLMSGTRLQNKINHPLGSRQQVGILWVDFTFQKMFMGQ